MKKQRVFVAVMAILTPFLVGCGRTYIHRLEYVPIPSPISSDVWMIQQDTATNVDRLMICRMANLEPACHFYSIESRTSTGL